MSARDAVARLLTLVPWLLERPGASVDEAAEAFGVDRRTILRDLDTVGYCGLPGLGGGDLFEVSVVGDRILVELVHELDEPLRLNPREALRLVLTAEAVAAAMGEELPALNRAVAELRRAAGVDPNVAIELTEFGTGWLSDLRRAIDEARQVRFSYRGRGETVATDRTLHPWKLHVAEGSWYVQGLDPRHGEPRTFRLDRIADLEVLDAPADPPSGDLRPPRYSPGPDDVEVEVVVPRASRWVAEALLADDVEDLPDGRRRITFHTDAPRWVAGLLLGAGPDVEVVRPLELAETLREVATATRARYR